MYKIVERLRELRQIFWICNSGSETTLLEYKIVNDILLFKILKISKLQFLLSDNPGTTVFFLSILEGRCILLPFFKDRIITFLGLDGRFILNLPYGSGNFSDIGFNICKNDKVKLYTGSQIFQYRFQGIGVTKVYIQV